jgi:anti-sigma regulatory factor (Ser/Thr protein kinase)
MHETILLTLPNDLRELHRVNEVANAFLERRGIAHETVYVTNLAIEEILSNVIKYGYADTGRHEISVSLRVDDGQVELQVVDDGRQFDPMSAPEVDVCVPLEERHVGGLGIHLLRTMATRVRYRRTEGRNHLSVRI